MVSKVIISVQGIRSNQPGKCATSFSETETTLR